MIKRVVSSFLIFLIILLPISLAQQISRGSNYDRTCERNSCITSLYSFEKYWLNENQEWEEIDESWYQCENNYCTRDYYFNTTADSQGQIISNLNNQQLSMQLSGLLNQNLNFNPVIQGSVLTYENIVPNVDLRYQYLPRKLKEEIIIKQPLQNINSNFNIEFTKSGNADFTFADSIICDSRGYCETINHEINSNNFQLEIPIDFLTNETTVYPVIIDPTLLLDDSDVAWNGRVEDNQNSDEPLYIRLNNPSTLFLGNVAPLVYERGAMDWNLSKLDDRATILNTTLQLYIESYSAPNYFNITNMEGSSYNYPNNNSGNMFFYQDIANGSNYSFASASIPSSDFYINLSFDPAGVSEVQDSLTSNVLSLGIDTDLTKTLNISARDHATASQRPVLIIEHSYESYDLQYDANGNLIEGFGKKLTYDGWNRLVEVNDSDGTIIEDYVYDHTGKRVRKKTYDIDTDGNNLSSYYIAGRPALFVHNRITNGTIYNQTYIYLYDKLIARIDDNDKKFFYHPDHLGSTTLITNESGDVVQYISYLPFGEVLSGDLDNERFGFTGQENDASGFIDYGNRQYDSKFRRFVQCDSIIPDIYNPQDLNCYAYVRNNPYKYVDETGEFPVTVVAGLVAGAVVGSIQGYITYQQTGDLGKAFASGAISGGATALTVATLGAAASTTAVAGGAAARYVGTSAAGAGLFSGGVGAAESVLQQTLVQGKGLGDISYGDVAISAGANSLGGSLIGKSGLPGVISRGKGTFFPSTFGAPFGKETISKTSQSLYSEGAELGIKKLIGDELYLVNNQFTSQLPVNEEGGGNRNRAGSGSGGGGGGFGSSTPPNQYQTPIGGCGVVMSCL